MWLGFPVVLRLESSVPVSITMGGRFEMWRQGSQGVFEGIGHIIVGADECGEAGPLALASYDIVRVENMPCFLARTRASWKGLVPASPAKGSFAMDWGVRWRQYRKEVEVVNLQKYGSQMSSIMVRESKLRYWCLLKGSTVKFHVRAYACCGSDEKRLLGEEKRGEKVMFRQKICD